MGAIVPFEDALITLSPAQQDAMSTLAQAGDGDARRSIEHWIERWDKAMERGDTRAMAARRAAALRVWAPYIFTDGAGI